MDKFTPPKAAQEAAKKVLRWKELYPDEIKGMTPVGWARARQLASGKSISLATVKRMAQFNRHRKNAKVAPEHKGEPWEDAGHVAWLGWGGTAGVDWAIRTSKQERTDAQKCGKGYIPDNKKCRVGEGSKVEKKDQPKAKRKKRKQPQPDNPDQQEAPASSTDETKQKTETEPKGETARDRLKKMRAALQKEQAFEKGTTAEKVSILKDMVGNLAKSWMEGQTARTLKLDPGEVGKLRKSGLGKYVERKAKGALKQLCHSDSDTMDRIDSLRDRLQRLRDEIESSGAPLLDWEGVEQEKRDRRGGVREDSTRTDYNPHQIKRYIIHDGMRLGIQYNQGDRRKPHFPPLGAAYGMIIGTYGLAADKMCMDCYLAKNPKSGKVFVITQTHPNGEFDEHKYMLGFEDAIAAKNAFLAHMPIARFGAIREMRTKHLKQQIEQQKLIARRA